MTIILYSQHKFNRMKKLEQVNKEQQDFEQNSINSFTNPVCQQTFESLPKIYGVIKKRILTNKKKFYQNIQKRALSGNSKKRYESQHLSRQITDEKQIRHRAQIHLQEQQANKKRIKKANQISNKAKNTATFSNKFHKLQTNIIKNIKKDKIFKDHETNHKVKINTANFLPQLYHPQSQTHNIGEAYSSSKFRDNISKSISINNPLINLYKISSQEKGKQKYLHRRRYTEQIQEETSQDNQSPNSSAQKHYTPKNIFKSLKKADKNQQKSKKKITEINTIQQSYNNIRKTNGQTEFSKRILSDKSKGNFVNDPTSNKYHIPTKDQYKDFIHTYQPLNPAFSLKKLVKSPHFQIISYKNAVYFGQIQNQVRKGQAVFITENFIFQGFFENDSKLKGNQQNQDGVYTGYFKNNLRHGKGRFQWNNGQVFEGDWKDGKKNGKGVWISPKGDCYQGEWMNGRQHGNGVHKHKNSTYKGQFVNSLKNGNGQQLFANGDRFKGYYQKGKPHGHGRYEWNDGSFYEGQFKCGYRDGKGVLSQINGTMYKAKALSREILSTVLGKRYQRMERDTKENSMKDPEFIKRCSSDDFLNLDNLLYCEIDKWIKLNSFESSFCNDFGSLFLFLFSFSISFFLFLFFLLLWSSVQLLFEFFKTIHSDLSGGGNTGCKLKSTSSKSNLASSTFPYSRSFSSDLWLNEYIVTFPQAGQTYLALCCSQNFFTIFLIAEPYLVPNLPVTPTFFVLLAINQQIYINSINIEQNILDHLLIIYMDQINYLCVYQSCWEWIKEDEFFELVILDVSG